MATGISQKALPDAPRRSALRTLALVAAGGLLAAILIAAFLARFHAEIIEPMFARIDYWLPNTFYAHSSPGLTKFMFLLTTIGSPLSVVIIFLVALAVLLVRKRWGEAIAILSSEIGVLILNQVAKTLFHRARPTWTWAFAHESNFSFPSGHAMLGIVSFGTIAFLLCRYFHNRAARVVIVTVATLLIIGIGLSRVYLGVHYPSDIAAGWIAGGIWLAAVITGTELLHRAEPKVRPPADQPQSLDN